MNRRTAIKQFAAITAGLALLPSCSDGLRIDPALSEGFSFSPEQGVWLSALSQAILPSPDQGIETLEDFPTFVATRLEKLKSTDEQLSFVRGYNEATKQLKDRFKKSSVKISPVEVITYFTDLKSNGISATEEKEKLQQQHLISFVDTMKGLSMKHLTTSKTYMQQRLEYNILPGQYQGCVSI